MTMKKFKMKLGIFLGTGVMLAVAGCAKETPVETRPASATLEGSWDYTATDGQDLTGYGISYQFANGVWTYQLSDAGTKRYAYTTNGGSFSARLTQNTLPSGEAIGSALTGTFRIVGDTLTMSYGGHVATLTRHVD